MEIGNMKKAIVFLFIILGILDSIGQENNCNDTELYHLVFEELNLYKKKAVEIEIGYNPNEFTTEGLAMMEIFNNEEMKKFNRDSSQELNPLSCTKLKNQVQSILSDDRIGKNGSYMKYVFSKVIPISDSKKCILMNTIIKSKKYTGGKLIGDEMIYILKNNSGKWSLIDKKSIAMY